MATHRRRRLAGDSRLAALADGELLLQRGTGAAAGILALADAVVGSGRLSRSADCLGDRGDASALRDEIALDTLIDLEEVYPRAMAELDEPSRHALHVHIAALAAALA